MSSKRVRSVTKKPIYSIGLFPIAGGSVEFCPTELFKEAGVAPAQMYRFKIRQYTVAERAQIESDNEMVQAKGALWAQQNGIDLAGLSTKEGEAISSDIASRMVATTKAFSALSDRQLRADLIRRCIVGMSNFCDSEGAPIEYAADPDGGLAKDLFDMIPDAVTAAIGFELSRISYLDSARRLGL